MRDRSEVSLPPPRALPCRPPPHSSQSAGKHTDSTSISATCVHSCCAVWKQQLGEGSKAYRGAGRRRRSLRTRRGAARPLAAAARQLVLVRGPGRRSSRLQRPPRLVRDNGRRSFYLRCLACCRARLHCHARNPACCHAGCGALFLSLSSQGACRRGGCGPADCVDPDVLPITLAWKHVCSVVP